MLNNANGASVWTQLVQITALTNWLDSSQQSWGVCQDPVLGWEESPGPPPRRSSRTRAPRISTGGDWRASAGGRGAGGWEGPLTLYFPPSEDGGAWAGEAAGSRRGWGSGRIQHPSPWGARGRPRRSSSGRRRTRTRDRHSDRDPILRIYWGVRPKDAEAWEKRRETHGFLEEGVASTRGWGRGGGWNLAEANARHRLVQCKPSRAHAPAPPSSPDSRGTRSSLN